MRNKALVSMASVCVIAVFLLGSNCGDKDRTKTTDPLKEQAEDHYKEGRRLFLTCDPNNYPKALDQFKQALTYYDDYPEALSAWAETVSMYYGFFLPESQFQEAYMKAQRATRLDPELDMGYRAMADLFRHHKNQQTGKYDDKYAMDIIERALKINPQSAENLYVKGSILLDTDPLQARDILTKAVDANPNLGKSYFNLASAYEHIADMMVKEVQGKPEEFEKNKDKILAYYQKAIDLLSTYQQLVPRDIGGYCSQGIIYMRTGKIDDAEKDFQKTVSVVPDPDPSLIKWTMLAYLHLAQISENQKNDPEEAKMYLELALKSAPKNLEVLGHLKRLADTKLKDKELSAKYDKLIQEALEAQKAKAAAASAAEGGTVDGGTQSGSTAAP